MGVVEGCQLHDAQIPLVCLAGARPQQGRHTHEDGTQATSSCAVRFSAPASRERYVPEMRACGHGSYMAPRSVGPTVHQTK